MNLNNINFLIKIVVILSRNINKSATSYNPYYVSIYLTKICFKLNIQFFLMAYNICKTTTKNMC